MPYRTTPVLLFAILTACFPVAAAAQSQTEGDLVVRFALLIDGKQELEAAANYGELITVEIQERGSYGFIPRMAAGEAVAEVQVFDISDVGIGEARRHLQTLTLGFNEPVALAADTGISVKIYRVERNRFTGNVATAYLATLVAPEFSPFSEEGTGNCCVTCGNVTACGCAVTMSCGCCCAECSNEGCPECVLGGGGGLASGLCGATGNAVLLAAEDL